LFLASSITIITPRSLFLSSIIAVITLRALLLSPIVTVITLVSFFSSLVTSVTTTSAAIVIPWKVLIFDGRKACPTTIEAIAEFLADPARTSFELPHMTTGQRKHARRVADQCPEIKCESYGFGPDRRLHFFKDAKAFMRRNDAEKEPSESTEAASPNLSRTSSEERGSALDDLDADGRSHSPELIRVRNTFINVESASPVDERVVQSMPHGMFSSCWLVEAGLPLAQSPQLGAACIAPPPAAAAPNDIFTEGSEIIVEGLTRCPAFNGLRGTVQSFDEEAGRYNVLLETDGSSVQYAKIRAENLRLGVPPPPPFEAQRPAELQLHSEECTEQWLANMPTTPEWQNQSTCQQLVGAVAPAYVHTPNFYPQPVNVVHAAR